jgi:tetratricopeptide (TPR) repeat protein
VPGVRASIIAAMSESNLEVGAPPPFKPDQTQPLKPVKKRRRLGSILLGIGGILVLLVLGGLGGYTSGIAQREQAQSSIISQQLMDQFQYALVDEQFGRYEAARERLQFIIQHSPDFPGAQTELAKVLVQLTVPTPTPTTPPTPTADLRGVQNLFASAQQLVAAGDWKNALATLDQLRKDAPDFNAAQVDGMYYYALRNYGVSLIQQQGDLEGGIYELTLAERFAPLDNTANGLRDGARAYIQAASYFGVNWQKTVELFRNVAGGWPAMWDGSMNANQRLHLALMRYGDELFASGNDCAASDQYQEAQGLGDLDPTSAKNANQAYQICHPATEVPPTEAPVPEATTEVPPGPPTEAPTATSETQTP